MLLISSPTRVSLPFLLGSWLLLGLFWRCFSCRIAHLSDIPGIIVQTLSYVAGIRIVDIYEDQAAL